MDAERHAGPASHRQVAGRAHPRDDPGLQYGIKWKKAYYGLPDQGWILEIVAYDVSVNVVFLGGADFDAPPPLGEGDRSRYVKLTTLEEAQRPQIRAWIEEAGACLVGSDLGVGALGGPRRVIPGRRSAVDYAPAPEPPAASSRSSTRRGDGRLSATPGRSRAPVLRSYSSVMSP